MTSETSRNLRATNGPVPRTAERPLRVLAVEEDASKRAVLARCLERCERELLLKEASGLADARESLVSFHADLVFVSMELRDGDLFEFIRTLGGTTQWAGISATGARASLAFDFDATDFLVLPLGVPRLRETLNRAVRRIGWEGTRSGNRREARSRFLLKTSRERQVVNAEEVSHISAYGEYSWVHWAGDRSLLVRKTLKQWERELPGGGFARIHRGMIVNLSHIEHLQRLHNGQLQVRLRGATGEFRVSLRMAGRFGREISQLHSPAACQ